MDVQDDDGMTPLHKAASESKIEVVEVLLKYGADKALKDKHGRTPKDLAKEQKLHQIL